MDFPDYWALLWAWPPPSAVQPENAILALKLQLNDGDSCKISRTQESVKLTLILQSYQCCLKPCLVSYRSGYDNSANQSKSTPCSIPCQEYFDINIEKATSKTVPQRLEEEKKCLQNYDFRCNHPEN